MASTISTTGYNAAFPVAGQDNDSQGFRTNFNVTKVALEAAKGEITTLQDDTAKLNADNAFNGSVISEAKMQANTETVNANGNVTASQNISWADGHYQTLQAGGDITLTLADWPESGVMGRIRLQLASDGSSRGAGAFTGTTVLASQTNPIFIDFWSINGGVTVFAQDHGTFD